MIMPWGKHKGEDMEDIPSGYLKWLVENCEQEEIQEAAEQEWGYRSDWDRHFWEAP